MLFLIGKVIPKMKQYKLIRYGLDIQMRKGRGSARLTNKLYSIYSTILIS